MAFEDRRVCVWLLAGMLAAGVTVAGEPEGPDHSGESHATNEEMEHGMEEMSPEMQEMMEAFVKAGTPGEEHDRLAESTGTWKATVESFMGPGEPQISEATATREMILDGRVLSERFEGTFMGEPFVGHGMTGYDNAREMYWSTWVDSMSTGVMTSWGHWDEEKEALVLEGTMTNAMTGEPMQVEMIWRFPELGSETFEMWEPHGDDGEMVKTMEITSVKQ